MDIAQLTAAFRSGELSPHSVVETSLRKARETASSINAFVTIFEEAALAAAREAEKAFQQGREVRPLEGIPVTVKDNIPVAGHRLTYGSARYGKNVASRDAVAVQRLLSAGAIILGKTTTPEFACRQTTNSALFGVTRNPYDLGLTPGGSSGGSSASLAAGIGKLSLVTDGGGSARLPAACTGVVGLKPTLGRIPFDLAADAFGNFAHFGVMAASIDDVRSGLSVLSGIHPADPCSYALAEMQKSVLREANDDRPLLGLRVGWRARLAGEGIDAGILRTVEQALQVMETAGANIEEFDESIEPPLPIWQTLQHVGWAMRFGDDRLHLDSIDPVIAAGIEHARTVSVGDLHKAKVGRTRLYRAVQRWFERFDIVVSPTMARPPLPAEHSGAGDIDIMGAPAGDIRAAWAPLLSLFTLTGHPSITLNCGWHDGLPVGLQVVGRWSGDEALLSTAKRIEQVLEVPIRRPEVVPGKSPRLR